MEDSLIQVVIPGFPAGLLEKIDRIAKKEDRSRSAMIRVLLKDRVEQIGSPDEAKELVEA